MHDEPTIEVMNYIGLDTIGVGNHEFDEGKAELLRMQYGNSLRRRRHQRRHGLRPGTAGRLSSGRRLPGRHAVLRLGLPVPRRERDRHEHEQPAAAAYRIVNTSEGEKVAFIGETLQGTPLDRHTDGRGRPRVPRRGGHGQRDSWRSCKQRQVSTIVLLLHEGGFQNAPFSRGFVDVNKCENFTGAGPARHRQPARPGCRRRRQRSHAPAVHVPLQRPARDLGRLVRPADHVDRSDDRPARRQDGRRDR